MTTHAKGLLAIFICALLWGSAGSVGKLLLLEGHPFVVIFYRFAAATLLVLPFFLAAKKPKGWLIDLIPLGFFNGLNVLFYFSGLAHTTANTGSLLGAGVPILTALLSWVLIGEKVSRDKLIGIIIGLSGAVLIILVPLLDRGHTTGTSLIGNLYMVGSAVAWTLYIVKSRSSAGGQSFSPIVATFVNFSSCTVMAGIACLLIGKMPILPALATPTYLALFAYAVIGVTGISFFLFQWALQHVSATTASLKEYLQIIVGVTVNAIVLGERFTPTFTLGSALILIGVMIATGNRLSKKILALIESRTS